MNDPESNTGAWVQKAENDLLAVDSMLAAERVPWDVVCYHAQQVAEKLLKAFLLYHGHTPAKTHDLVFLLKPCLEIEPSLRMLENDCEDLNEYGGRMRYPADIHDPDGEEAMQLVEAARRVRSAILERLPEPGV